MNGCKTPSATRFTLPLCSGPVGADPERSDAVWDTKSRHRISPALIDSATIWNGGTKCKKFEDHPLAQHPEERPAASSRPGGATRSRLGCAAAGGRRSDDVLDRFQPRP